MHEPGGICGYIFYINTVETKDVVSTLGTKHTHTER